MVKYVKLHSFKGKIRADSWMDSNPTWIMGNQKHFGALCHPTSTVLLYFYHQIFENFQNLEFYVRWFFSKNSPKFPNTLVPSFVEANPLWPFPIHRPHSLVSHLDSLKTFCDTIHSTSFPFSVTFKILCLSLCIIKSFFLSLGCYITKI